MGNCNAAQQGDEMACGRCGLRWSVGDVDRPQCRDGLPPVPTRPLVGFERRQVPEVKRRLEAPTPRVDYRELLAKYIRHTRAEDGNTGVNWIGIEGRGYFSDVLFSPEEVAALKACADVAG